VIINKRYYDTFFHKLWLIGDRCALLPTIF